MSNRNQTSPLCVATYQSPCGNFHAHWFRYGQSKFFAPVLVDSRTGHLYRAVIPHDANTVVFVPAQKRAAHTSPFVSRFEDIEVSHYNADQLLAEFACFLGGAA